MSASVVSDKSFTAVPVHTPVPTAPALPNRNFQTEATAYRPIRLKQSTHHKNMNTLKEQFETRPPDKQTDKAHFYFLNRQNPEFNAQIYQSKNFESLSGADYAGLLQAPKADWSRRKGNEAINHQFLALPRAQRTTANLATLHDRLNASIDMSAGLTLAINFHDRDEPFVVVADSARRGRVYKANGKCEIAAPAAPTDHMFGRFETTDVTAYREMREEYGNPAEKGMLRSIVDFKREAGNPAMDGVVMSVLADKTNWRSKVYENTIGTSVEEINKNALNAGKPLYLSVSYFVANTKGEPINGRHVTYDTLKSELDDLTKRLASATELYSEMVTAQYGDKKHNVPNANYANPEALAKVAMSIKKFTDNHAALITQEFESLFENPATDIETVKQKVSAIIDLTENKAVYLHPLEGVKADITQMLIDKMEKERTGKKPGPRPYFKPSLEDFTKHGVELGCQSIDQFLNLLSRFV